jgi:hypothetical protein
VGVIYRVHRYTAYARPYAQVPGTTRFSDYNVLMFHVANLTNGCPACLQNEAEFA